MKVDTLSPDTIRRICFLVGPLIGCLLIAGSVWINVGPGLFLLSVLGAFVLIVLAPIAQFILLKMQAYQGRYVAACFTAIAGSIVFLFLAAFTGAFSFW